MKITNETKVVGSISSKQSSLGAAMHNTAYEYLRLNFVYTPFVVTDCKNAIVGIRALNFRGTAVSMPHKQEVMRYLDKIDSKAKEIGAVNTVLNENGVLTGYNSDWIGAVEALKEVTRLENKKVILVGAGGVARAISYGLSLNKAKVILFNRSLEKAKELSQSFNLELGGDLNSLKDAEDYHILVNATSVGSAADHSKNIIPENIIERAKVVMDVVHTPVETPLLKLASKKNCKIVPGYRMLIHQALFQFELFTGKKAPFEVMVKAVLQVIKNQSSSI